MNNLNIQKVYRKIRQLHKLTDFLFKATFTSPFSLILLFGTWLFNLLQPLIQVFNFEYEKNVSVNCSITTIFTVSIFFIWNMLYQTYGQTKRSGSFQLIEIRPVTKQWFYIAHLLGYIFTMALFLIPLALTPTLTERISEHLITDQGSPYYFKDLLTALIFSFTPLLALGITMLFKKGIVFFITSFNFLSIIAFVIIALMLGEIFKTGLLTSSFLIASIILTLMVLSISVIFIKHKIFKLIPFTALLLGFFFYPLLSQFAFFRILIPPYGHALNLAITSPSMNQIMPYIIYSLAYSTGVITISTLLIARVNKHKM